MNRRNFISITGTSLVLAGGAAYLLSDRNAVVRSDAAGGPAARIPLQPDERKILHLASLAPSGHNTQPWRVKYLEPWHWIVSNDRGRWLPAVDPAQRETVLSIGAFLQNLEYAASGLGYEADFRLLADSNQAEDLVEVFLRKTGGQAVFDLQKIRLRRTVRSGYLNETIRQSDVDYLTDGEADFFHFFSNRSREYRWLNEQTIEANRRQTCRDDAQLELGAWMRFSSRDARAHLDGLTTASMEIGGFSGWLLRNFYSPGDVMGRSFREQGIEKVKAQVNRSGGWLLLSSPDSSTASLIDCGRRLQRMLLKIRDRNIAVHPMTQVLEEAPHRDALVASTGISAPVQFILRTGYLPVYPEPVSLRRPVEYFVQ